MEGNEPMDSRLRKRMCHVSIEQSSNPQKEGSPLSYHNPRNIDAIPTNRNGSNHETAQSPRKRRYPHYRRPWLLTSSNIPPVHVNYHQPRNCATVPGQRLQVVRTP